MTYLDKIMEHVKFDDEALSLVDIMGLEGALRAAIPLTNCPYAVDFLQQYRAQKTFDQCPLENGRALQRRKDCYDCWNGRVEE